MIRKYTWFLAMMVILPLALGVAGCSDNFGKVDQGRVIEFDKTKRTVTLIRDIGKDIGNPDYSYLPPVVYSLPENPDEMGPEPKPGKRMKLDTKNRQLVIYVPSLQNFAKINYTLIDSKEDVNANDPLVFDAAESKAKKFPVVDKIKKTITIYSKRLKNVTTFSVPDEYFALPDDTWDNGDEVRVYYKQDGKSLRFMNVSKTDIFKK